MDDLVGWLGEQLDEDERIARAATPGPWSVNDTSFAETIYGAKDVAVVAGGRWGGEAPVFESDEDAAHIAEHDPARVLREIDGKRRTLIRCQEEMFSGIPRLVHFAQETLREMALGFSHRPGYETAIAAAE